MDKRTCTKELHATSRQYSQLSFQTFSSKKIITTTLHSKIHCYWLKKQLQYSFQQLVGNVPFLIQIFLGQGQVSKYTGGWTWFSFKSNLQSAISCNFLLPEKPIILDRSVILISKIVSNLYQNDEMSQCLSGIVEWAAFKKYHSFFGLIHCNFVNPFVFFMANPSYFSSYTRYTYILLTCALLSRISVAPHTRHYLFSPKVTPGFHPKLYHRIFSYFKLQLFSVW